MTRRVLALLLGVMIVFGGVAGCKSSTSAASSGSPSGQASAMASGSAGTSAAGGTCSQVGTRKIPKTRLLADLGLAYGAFHRYLYKPYEAGSFRKGASGRVSAIIKAGLASAAIIKLLDNAVKNAAADKTLCRFVPNMNSIKASLGTLAGKIRHGTASSADVSGTSGLFDQLKSSTGFTPPANASLPGLG